MEDPQVNYLISEFFKDISYLYSEAAKKAVKCRKIFEKEPQLVVSHFVKYLKHMNYVDDNCFLLLNKLIQNFEKLSTLYSSTKLDSLISASNDRKAYGNRISSESIVQNQTSLCTKSLVNSSSNINVHQNGISTDNTSIIPNEVNGITTEKRKSIFDNDSSSDFSSSGDDNGETKLPNIVEEKLKDNDISLGTDNTGIISNQRNGITTEKRKSIFDNDSSSDFSSSGNDSGETRPSNIVEEKLKDSDISLDEKKVIEIDEEAVKIENYTETVDSDADTEKLFLENRDSRSKTPTLTDYIQVVHENSNSFDNLLQEKIIDQEIDESANVSNVKQSLPDTVQIQNESSNSLDNLLEIKNIEVEESANVSNVKYPINNVNEVYRQIMMDDSDISDNDTENSSSYSEDNLSSLVSTSSKTEVNESESDKTDIDDTENDIRLDENISKEVFMAHVNLVPKNTKLRKGCSVVENAVITKLLDEYKDFNIKELSVNIPECPELEETLRRYRPRRTRYQNDNVDRLCDLNTILKQNRSKPQQRKKKKIRTKKKDSSNDIVNCDSSSSSDSCIQDYDIDLCQGDSDQSCDELQFLENVMKNINSDSENYSNFSDSEIRKRTRKKKKLISDDMRNNSLLNGTLTSSEENLSDTDSTSSSSMLNKKLCYLNYKDDSDFELSSDSNSDSNSGPVYVNLKTPEPEAHSSKEAPIIRDPDSDAPIEISDTEAPQKGRKNIRALVSDECLAQTTREAKRSEVERVKRVKQYNKQLEEYEKTHQCDSLVLDVSDPQNIIKVHPNLSKRLKPHQVDGVKFMWNCCYESVESIRTFDGTGCILAHCMGLGKSFQVIALIDTLLNNTVTQTNHILIVSPLSVVLNWKNEFFIAFKKMGNINFKVYFIANKKDSYHRYEIIQKWRSHRGVLIVGYECFEKLVGDKSFEKMDENHKSIVLQSLIDPGPDLVICDEGHLLKSKKSQRTIALNKVTTKRRIVLTGTPLQNNLKEYYFMVQFVKPNLLGTLKEYTTNFINPITNGQFEDSTSEDIRLMKKRTHVLCEMLKSTIQRKETSELESYLPKIRDYAIFIKLNETQITLYKTFLKLVAQNRNTTKACSQFFSDYRVCSYIASHPYILKLGLKKTSVKSSDYDERIKDLLKHCPEGIMTNLNFGHKFLILKSILEEAESVGDKVLIFSKYLAEMDCIEHFLKKHGTSTCSSWERKKDYLRMDGSVTTDVRNAMCASFNNSKNSTLRLLILSHSVGGVGLNLVGANRVILMGVNFNPSNDLQSVYRAYRFGQKKDCFIYRLIGLGTMEEKVYHRCITKLAVSSRVVDKQQITRHYKSMELQEMYNENFDLEETRPTPNVPEDALLAKLILKYEIIFKYHEHQSLLKNKPEEELNEHEKNLAWEEFNKMNDGHLKARNFIGPLPNITKDISKTHLGIQSVVTSNIIRTSNGYNFENIIPRSVISNNTFNNRRKVEDGPDSNNTTDSEVIFVDSTTTAPKLPNSGVLNAADEFSRLVKETMERTAKKNTSNVPIKKTVTSIHGNCSKSTTKRPLEPDDDVEIIEQEMIPKKRAKIDDANIRIIGNFVIDDDDDTEDPSNARTVVIEDDPEPKDDVEENVYSKLKDLGVSLLMMPKGMKRDT